MTSHIGRKAHYLASIAIITMLFSSGTPGNAEEADFKAFDLTSPFSVEIVQTITIEGTEYLGKYRAIFHHEKRAFRLAGKISALHADESYDILVTGDGETVGVRVAAPDKTTSRRFAKEEFDRHADEFSIYNGLSPKTYKTAIQKSRYRRNITAEHDANEEIKVFRISVAYSRRQPAISRLHIHICERRELPVRVVGMDGEDKDIMTLDYSDYQRAAIEDMDIFSVAHEHPRPESPTVEE